MYEAWKTRPIIAGASHLKRDAVATVLKIAPDAQRMTRVKSDAYLAVIDVSPSTFN
jgi:hypothetical protein